MFVFLMVLLLLLGNSLNTFAAANAVLEGLQKPVILPQGAMGSEELERLLCETSYPSGIWEEGQCKRSKVKVLLDGKFDNLGICILLGCRETQFGCSCKEVSPLGGIKASITKRYLLLSPNGWIFVAGGNIANTRNRTRFAIFELSSDYQNWSLKVGGDVESDKELNGIQGPFIHSGNKVQLLVKQRTEWNSRSTSTSYRTSSKTGAFILTCSGYNNCSLKYVVPELYYNLTISSSYRYSSSYNNAFTYYFEQPAYVSDKYYVTAFYLKKSLSRTTRTYGSCGSDTRVSGSMSHFPLGFAGKSDLEDFFVDVQFKTAKMYGFIAPGVGIFHPSTSWGATFPYQEGYIQLEALARDTRTAPGSVIDAVFPFIIISTPSGAHYWVSESGNYFYNTERTSIPYSRSIGTTTVRFALKKGNGYLVFKVKPGGFRQGEPFFFIDWQNTRTIISGDKAAEPNLFVLYESCVKKTPPSNGRKSPFLMECNKYVNSRFAVKVNGQGYVPDYVRFYSNKALLVYEDKNGDIYFEIPVNELFNRAQNVGKEEIYLNFPPFVQNDTFNYHMTFSYTDRTYVGYWYGCWRTQTKTSQGGFQNQDVEFSSLSYRPDVPQNAQNTTYIPFTDVVQAKVSFEFLELPKIYRITSANLKEYVNGTCSPQPSGEFVCLNTGNSYSSQSSCQNACSDDVFTIFCRVASGKMYCRKAGEFNLREHYVVFKSSDVLLYGPPPGGGARRFFAFESIEKCQDFLNKYYRNYNYRCSKWVPDSVRYRYNLGSMRAYWSVDVGTCKERMNYLCEESGTLFTGESGLAECQKKCIILQ